MFDRFKKKGMFGQCISNHELREMQIASIRANIKFMSEMMEQAIIRNNEELERIKKQIDILKNS